MTDALSLQYEVADIVGLDAWKFYEKDGSTENRHLIAETILLGLAGALIGDFLKGFIKPEELGQSLRARLDKLTARLRNRDFSSDDGELIDLLNTAQTAAAQAAPAEVQKAEDSLAASLRTFGLDDSAARQKAAQIRASVLASLKA